MGKITDTTYSTAVPVGSDWAIGTQAAGPNVKRFLMSDVRDFTNMVHAALADAATTMAVNTLYVGSMAAWATANRTYTLPTTAAVGDRIAIMITGGNATYELIITAGTSDTLNGVAGGTEWSRLFITGEVVIMRCVTANSVWVVETDGRIQQAARMSLTGGDITTSAAATWIGVDLDTKELERGCVVTVAGAAVSTVKWRRASFIQISGSWSSKGSASCADNEQMGWSASYGGVPGTGTIMFTTTPNHAGTTAKPIPGGGVSMQSVPAGSVIQLSQYAATTADLGARALAYATYLGLVEIL